MNRSDDWRPAASNEALRARARLLRTIREFFHERGVLEVETPLLGHASVTDPFIESLRLHSDSGSSLYLQTSPELAMKRLLAAGAGPIFQISKAFRAGEKGGRHNPEFTILEWYRPGFDHHQLMDEMDGLLAETLDAAPAERLSYEEVFQRYVGVSPHRATAAMLAPKATELGLPPVVTGDLSVVDWLNLLMVQAIEPQLGPERPVFIYDYPETMAALARIRPETPAVAERFEVYFRGTELANGYHELTDASEQRRRFLADLDERRRRGLSEVEIDERFLAALECGLPDMAGVALGVDRLLMVAMGADSLRGVLSFPFDRA